MEVWGEASAAMLRDGTAAALGHGGGEGRAGDLLGRSGDSGEERKNQKSTPETNLTVDMPAYTTDSKSKIKQTQPFFIYLYY
jgi:hypothetical protein